MAHSSPGFICDSMLGRLAKKLRMLGFDTLFVPDADIPALLDMAALYKRIVLTRRGAFLKMPLPAAVSHIFIRSNDPAKQLEQVMASCGLNETDLTPFSMCLRCNARLMPISKQEAVGQVPDYVLSTVADFSACPQCGRIFWKGTHYNRMAEGLKKKEKHPGSGW